MSTTITPPAVPTLQSLLAAVAADQATLTGASVTITNDSNEVDTNQANVATAQAALTTAQARLATDSTAFLPDAVYGLARSAQTAIETSVQLQLDVNALVSFLQAAGLREP